MIHRCRIVVVVVGIAGSAIMPLAGAQHPDPNSPRYKGVVALSEFLTSKGDVALKEFVADRVSRQLRDSMNHERLTDALDQLRSGFTGARRSGARPEGPFAAYIAFSNNKSISFENSEIRSTMATPRAWKFSRPRKQSPPRPSCWRSTMSKPR